MENSSVHREYSNLRLWI